MMMFRIMLILGCISVTSCISRPPDASAPDPISIRLDDACTIDAIRMFNTLHFGTPDPRFTEDSLTLPELNKYRVTMDVANLKPDAAFQAILRSSGLSGEITKDGKLRVQKPK